MSLSPSPTPGLTSLERSVLEAGLRAPSPHNAQPWRFRRLGDGQLELIYAHADKLLCDPDDRDAYLSLGALLELMALRAGQEGSRLHFEPAQKPVDEGILVGRIELAGAATADPLAAHIRQRRTNRHPYARTRLPLALEMELRELGCLFFDPDAMSRLVDRRAYWPGKTGTSPSTSGNGRASRTTPRTE
jgi:nitroreductase